MKIKARIIIFITLMFLIMIAFAAYGASIVGSKHDLKHAYEVGSGLMKASLNNYGEVCVYCHTPHSANTSIGAPLWNRNASSTTYTVYGSPTMKTTPSNPPSGISKACLSCHDGVQAVDAIINAPGSGLNTGGPWYGQSAALYHFGMKEGANNCGECHTGGAGHDARAAYLGTDLSNDHPISMTYPSTSDFNPSPDLPLFSGKVECASCHDPHDPTRGAFLRKSNSGSALCLTCHIK